MKLAFIGLGKMGSAMARNLLAAGNEVAVWNRSLEKMEALRNAGAHPASSPAEACRGAAAVFSMLADDRAVEDTGIPGVLDRGSIHISCSTISTAFARRLAAEHAAKNQGFVSAPVFGRPDAAITKKLLIVAAGPKELIDRCQPLFAAIGRQTLVAGPEPWHANLMKICGNFTIAGVIEAMGEVFAVLRKSGVSPELFLNAISEVYGSPLYRNYGQQIIDSKSGPGGFALKLGLKDVRLMLQAADECTAPMPLASLVRDNLLAAMANGQGEWDWSSLAQVAARNAGFGIAL